MFVQDDPSLNKVLETILNFTFSEVAIICDLNAKDLSNFIRYIYSKSVDSHEINEIFAEYFYMKLPNVNIPGSDNYMSGQIEQAYLLQSEHSQLLQQLSAYQVIQLNELDNSSLYLIILRTDPYGYLSSERTLFPIIALLNKVWNELQQLNSNKNESYSLDQIYGRNKLQPYFHECI